MFNYFNYIHLNSLKLTIRSYSSKKDNINYGGKNRRGCQKQFSRFQTVQQAHTFLIFFHAKMKFELLLIAKLKVT